MEADAATIAGAVGSLISGAKSLADAVSEARSKVRGNKAAEDDLRTIQESISALQSRTFEIQEIVFGIQQALIQAEREKLNAEREKLNAERENAELRENIRQEEERSAERKEYVLKQFGRATVRVKESEPHIYFCPVCFEKQEWMSIPLQSLGTGTHKCPSCVALFPIGHV